MTNIQLESTRILLRELNYNDLTQFHELETNRTVTKFLTNYSERSLEDTLELLDHVIKQYEKYRTGRLAIIDKQTKKFVGWCGIKYNESERNKYKEFYDLGYRIDPQYWGKGYATEASQLCLEFGINDLKIRNIHAIVHSQNAKSLNVLNKVGFKLKDIFLEHNIQKFWFEYEKS